MKRTFTAKTSFGTFTRTSARNYLWCIARKDGWHMFSASDAAAKRELTYHQRKGREVEMVQVEAA